MPKKTMKIQDPKLRKLLEQVKKKKTKAVAAPKARATFHVKRSTARRPAKRSASETSRQLNFYADKARALEAALARMKAERLDPTGIMEKTKKAIKKARTLRIPSLPADHPFNRPRRKKAAKKRAKKVSRKPKGPSHLPPALLRDLGFAAPTKKRKRARKAPKRAKKATTRGNTRARTLRVPSLPADHPFNRPRRKKAAKKRAKRAGKKAVKRTTRSVKRPSTFHVKHRAKKTVKRSKKRTRR